MKRVVEGVNHQLLRKERLKQEEESRLKQEQRAKLLLGNELRLQEKNTKLQTEPPSEGVSSEVKQTKTVLLHVVHILYTSCTRPVHVVCVLYTCCTCPVHMFYTSCTRPVHVLYTSCTRPVYVLYIHARMKHVLY